MKSFIIAENDAHQRLDKFLKKLLPLAALSLIYRLNRKNSIKVNRKREDNEYKLQVGDIVEIYLRDEDYEKLSRPIEPAHPLEGTKGLDRSDIVYEDGELLIVNKNPGVIVHPGDHKTTEVSLIAQVHDYLGGKLSSLTFRPSLIHRIDRDTSGIVMIAKTKPALDLMLSELQTNRIEKVYHAVCLGTPTEPTGTIRKKLLRTEGVTSSNKITIDEQNGQKAVTHYRVLRTGLQGKYSLVECRLETGRMHQIRIHMASIGCPILGDETYGDRSENAFAKRNSGVSRQMLHAESVSFLHPSKKTQVTFHARYKDDMRDFLDRTQ